MRRGAFIGRVVSIVAGLAVLCLGVIPSGDVALTPAFATSARSSSAAGLPCDGLSVGALASPFSTYLATALPLLSQDGIDTSALRATIASPAVTSPASASVPPEIDDSITAMRALQKIDVHWQATFIAPVGSGWLSLAPPDSLEGQGIMAARSWKVTTSGGEVGVQVDDQTVGAVPSKGVAAIVRDAMLGLPCNVPRYTVTRDGAMDRFDGRLQPGVESDLLRQITGVTLPGTPTAMVSLAVDSQTHTWRAMEVRVVWPIVDTTVFGHPVVWGPGGRIALTFGTDQAPISPANVALPRQSPSAASLAASGIDSRPALKPIAGPVSAAITFLDIRALAGMRDQEPVLRSAISNAWQQGGGNSTDYQDAIQRYRDWERQTPLVGPFLRYVFPDLSAPTGAE